MKQILVRSIIILSVLFCNRNLYAQTLPNFDIIKLEQAADYKAATPYALQTANYLLSTPFQKNNSDRIKSLEFIYKWMSGTPDHSFVFDKMTGKLTNNNNDLLGIYMAAMVKYSLGNKNSPKDPKTIKLNALTLLLNYCENKDNNISMTKELKKLSEAKAKGQLEQAL